MPRSIPAENLNEAIRLYLVGSSPSEVRTATGVASTSLYREMRKRGIDARRPDPIPPTLGEDYRNGISEKALAERHGVSRSVVTRWLRDAGVERRDRSAAMYQRMADATPEERKRLAAAAHEGRRRNGCSLEEKVKRARTRQERAYSASPAEQLLAEWLGQRGVTGIVPQEAVGPWNVDLGIAPLAVEVFGGGWHAYGRHAARSEERYRYLLEHGRMVVVVWVSQQRYPLTRAAADYIADTETTPGEFRVIRGDGSEFARGDTSNLGLLVVHPGQVA